MFHYISEEEATEIHAVIISVSGGVHGISQPSIFLSLLSGIQDDGYYPELLDKASHLFFGFVKFHCFADGNKRTAILITERFLQNNNLVIENFAEKMEDIAIGIATNILEKEDVKKIFISMQRSLES